MEGIFLGGAKFAFCALPATCRIVLFVVASFGATRDERKFGSYPCLR